MLAAAFCKAMEYNSVAVASLVVPTAAVDPCPPRLCALANVLGVTAAGTRTIACNKSHLVEKLR